MKVIEVTKAFATEEQLESGKRKPQQLIPAPK
jgi:hypothetical protein